jgi:hypothetical protein
MGAVRVELMQRPGIDEGKLKFGVRMSEALDVTDDNAVENDVEGALQHLTVQLCEPPRPRFGA